MFPLKIKNVGEQCLWGSAHFYFSFILYKILAGKAKSLRSLVSPGKFVRLVKTAGNQDKPTEKDSGDGSYVHVIGKEINPLLHLLKLLIFVSISNTESCGCVSYLKLKNQRGFQAASCKQDPLLSTSLIRRWEMRIWSFFLSTILQYD